MRKSVLTGICALTLAAQVPPESAPAVIASLSGKAVISNHGGRRPARALDWLRDGMVVETAAGGRLTLVFVNGKRYEMGESAKVTITKEIPKNTSGPVHTLASFPPMPKFPAIAPEAEASARSAAIRIRGPDESLYPRDPFRTLADHTVLRFAPAGDAISYKIDIADEDGNEVFHGDTKEPEIAVPTGTLKAGHRYSWRVRALRRLGSNSRGNAEFATLGPEDTSSREAFKAGLQAADPQSLMLLAAVDRRLGLMGEARDELRAALDRMPGREDIRQDLETVERTINPTSGAR